MSNYLTLFKQELGLKVDCIAWNKKFKVIAVGTYELQENASRQGKIYFYSAEEKENYQELKILETLGGILDLRWEPQEQKLLAVATSNSIELYQLNSEKQLETVAKRNLEQNIIALYLSWINNSSFIFSDDAGFINIISLECASLNLTQRKLLHEFSVWIVHFHQKYQLVFTGSDDCKFKAFYLKELDNDYSHYMKRFDMGVTSIATKDNWIGIGSYDENLRIYEIECTQPKINLKPKIEIKLNGGVWRFLWMDSEEDEDNNLKIVSACSRGGTHIINFNSKENTCETIITNEENDDSLSYGLDIDYNFEEKSCIIASGYFETKVFHIWKINFKAENNI